MNTIRCSSLPRLIRCPASRIPPAVRINEESEASKSGTAVHRMISDGILVRLGGDKTWNPDPAYYAEIHGGEAKDLTFLYSQGMKFWCEIEGRVSNVLVECPGEAKIGDWLLTGHPDLIAEYDDEDGHSLLVVDWKSGVEDPRNREQLLGYAALALSGTLTTGDGLFHTIAPATIPLIKLCTVYLREGTKDVEHVTMDDFIAWRDALGEVLGAENPTFGPGPDSCKYCPRWHECPAWQQRIAALARAFADGTAIRKDGDASALVAMWADATMLKHAVERILGSSTQPGMVKEWLKITGLPLVCGDRTLYLDEQPRESIRFAQGWRQIAAQFGDMPTDAGLAAVVKRFADDISISKGGLLDAVGASVTKGKGKAKEQMMTELRNAGAVTENVVQVVKVR